MYYDNSDKSELNRDSLCALNVNQIVRNAYTPIYALRVSNFTRCPNGARNEIRGTSDREYDMYDKREITRVRNINVDILISILVILSMQGLIRWSAT